MNEIMQTRSGRGWAYFTMLLMLALSVAGNVAHTKHINPDPSIRQLVYAVAWPLMVWLGVELFVRVQWRDQLTDKLVRWVGITLVSSIAALVSYRHLRGLLIADNEEWTVYTFGPLAVDGLMLMATLALLLTRRLPAAAPAGRPESVDVEEILARHGITDELPVPVSPAPINNDEQPKRERAPRAGNGRTEELVRAMLEDPEMRPVNSTIRKYAKVARELRDNPHAEISAPGVRVDIIATVIRPWALSERVR